MGARSHSAVLLAALFALAIAASADQVTPTARVKSRLNVRSTPIAGSRVLLGLSPGDRVAHIGTRDGWHEVELADGTHGFVSATFSEILEEPEPAAIPTSPIDTSNMAPKRSRIDRFFRRLFGIREVVELVIAEPAVERVSYRHTDPDLPVSGHARTRGASRRYDIVLVLDGSTSTNEFAETDVDQDGRLEDQWMGDDSIYKAQLSAAASFVHVLSELPYNRSGQRIRVGLVSSAGEDRHRLSADDDELELTLETIRWLSHRDAKLEMALTGDYAAVDRRLHELWNGTPVGMTNVAAGIGRAVIELSGDALRGAESEPREDAEQLVVYLGDGKPRLPYDKHKAELAALYAGDLASRFDIRVDVFELGYNAVSRKKSRWLERMARGTGGRHTGVARPGDVVAALTTTRLSLVERVDVRNLTTGVDSPDVVTAIDGSFYSEIPLIEGSNRIRVDAVLDGGRRASEEFVVAYLPGAPTAELARQLKELRIENAALIAQTRAGLADEMAATRRAQRRELEISVDREDRVPR